MDVEGEGGDTEGSGVTDGGKFERARDGGAQGRSEDAPLFLPVRKVAMLSKPGLDTRVADNEAVIKGGGKAVSVLNTFREQAN